MSYFLAFLQISFDTDVKEIKKKYGDRDKQENFDV